jgi:hypothetical protein
MLISVSGGLDSTALLRLMIDLQQTHGALFHSVSCGLTISTFRISAGGDSFQPRSETGIHAG